MRTDEAVQGYPLVYNIQLTGDFHVSLAWCVALWAVCVEYQNL